MKIKYITPEYMSNLHTSNFQVMQIILPISDGEPTSDRNKLANRRQQNVLDLKPCIVGAEEVEASSSLNKPKTRKFQVPITLHLECHNDGDERRQG